MSRLQRSLLTFELHLRFLPGSAKSRGFKHLLMFRMGFCSNKNPGRYGLRKRHFEEISIHNAHPFLVAYADYKGCINWRQEVGREEGGDDSGKSIFERLSAKYKAYCSIDSHFQFLLYRTDFLVSKRGNLILLNGKGEPKLALVVTLSATRCGRWLQSQELQPSAWYRRRRCSHGP